MIKMTTKERVARMYAHQDADRVPIIDHPWPTTLTNWKKEGLPEDISYIDYFDLDKIGTLGANSSPRFPEETLEETDEYRIYTSAWGATIKELKNSTAIDMLDFTIIDRDSWEITKKRMAPSKDRIDWNELKTTYPTMVKNGSWIQANLCFGFDVTHSFFVGTERLLFALVENPEWCRDMFSHQLDTNLALLDLIWEAGYEFDSVTWCDDMGYKGTQFFSVEMYREILKPFHKRAIDWAHEKGIKARLHSCGDVNPFIPELLEMGLDCLNPLEVKAGMDPIHLKKTYGDDLVFHGGINALLWDDLNQLHAEIERVVPIMKENGGYIFSTDHSIPDNVSLEEFKEIIELIKDIGSY